MSDEKQLVVKENPEVPAVFVSETALLPAANPEEGIWIVLPGEEPHWQIEDWAVEAVENNTIPWWLGLVWLLYLLWMVWYMVYGSSHW